MPLCNPLRYWLTLLREGAQVSIHRVYSAEIGGLFHFLALVIYLDHYSPVGQILRDTITVFSVHLCAPKFTPSLFPPTSDIWIDG